MDALRCDAACEQREWRFNCCQHPRRTHHVMPSFQLASAHGKLCTAWSMHPPQATGARRHEIRKVSDANCAPAASWQPPAGAAKGAARRQRLAPQLREEGGLGTGPPPHHARPDLKACSTMRAMLPGLTINYITLSLRPSPCPCNPPSPCPCNPHPVSAILTLSLQSLTLSLTLTLSLRSSPWKPAVPCRHSFLKGLMATTPRCLKPCSAMPALLHGLRSNYVTMSRYLLELELRIADALHNTAQSSTEHHMTW